MNDWIIIIQNETVPYWKCLGNDRQLAFSVQDQMFCYLVSDTWSDLFGYSRMYSTSSLLNS